MSSGGDLDRNDGSWKKNDKASLRRMRFKRIVEAGIASRS